MEGISQFLSSFVCICVKYCKICVKALYFLLILKSVLKPSIFWYQSLISNLSEPHLVLISVKMSRLLARSFSRVDKRTVEVSSREHEYEDQALVDPSTWNPPALHASDIYQPTGKFLKKKLFLKEV